MQKNILSILMIVAVSLFVMSCDDGRLDNIPPPRMLIPQSGVVEQTIFRTGEPFVFRLGVHQTGYHGVTATARVHILSEAELNVYNAENGTNFRRLPDHTFQVPAGELLMNFPADIRTKFVNITIDYNAVEALPGFDEQNTEQYVIPVRLVHSSIEMNENHSMSFIKPLIREPLLFFRGASSSILIEPTSLETSYRQSITLDANFPNTWNISIDLAVDPALVAVYNAQHGTNHQLLPADSYTISPNPAVILSGRNTVLSTVIIDPEKVDFDDFVLPIVISNTSRFSADDTRNVHFLTVLKPAPIIDRSNWTIHDFSSEATNEGPYNRVWAILNDDPLQFWHSRWGFAGDGIPPHHVTMDMQQENRITHVELQRRNNNTVTRTGRFYISSDGDNFTQIGTFELPGVVQNSLQIFRVTPTYGRFLKVIVDSGAHAQLAIIRARGVAPD